jgi:hypothetical protein
LKAISTLGIETYQERPRKALEAILLRLVSFARPGFDPVFGFRGVFSSVSLLRAPARGLPRSLEGNPGGKIEGRPATSDGTPLGYGADVNGGKCKPPRCRWSIVATAELRPHKVGVFRSMQGIRAGIVASFVEHPDGVLL